MRVLITGATGFIGAEICAHLLKTGHEVLASGRSEDKLRRLAAYVPAGTGRFSTLRGSLGSLRDLPRGVNAVIHAAAVLDQAARVSPAAAVDTNVGGTVRLLDAANTGGVERFMLLSSQSVYGSAEPPWREDRRPDPRGVYALSKYAAEQAVLNKLAGMERVVLRVSRVYGTGLFMRWDELIGRLVSRTLAGRAIEVHGNGLQRLDLIHVRDLADAVGTLLDCGSALPKDVYNVGGGQSFTVREVAEAVQEAAAANGLSRPAVDMCPALAPTGPLHLELDSSRIRRDLNWEPRTPLRQGVQEYFLEHHEPGR